MVHKNGCNKSEVFAYGPYTEDEANHAASLLTGVLTEVIELGELPDEYGIVQEELPFIKCDCDCHCKN